jgi:vitamin K-dependent gamma-carboxylase
VATSDSTDPAARLFAEIDNGSLVAFRVFFGFLLFLESGGSIATGFVRKVFVEPPFTFSIVGFEWLRPLPGGGMYFYYAAMAAAALLVTAGAWFRPALLVFTLLWTGSYLMQTASYNNHYYLLILLCLLLLSTPAHAYFSYDAHRRPALRSLTCPRWCVLIFVVQTAILYFFAFVAKLDADWLAARPLAIWLAERTDYPIVGALYAQPWLPWVMAYGGLLYDGLAVPMLLWRRTRPLAVAFSLLFHLFNSITFQIGIFPYLAIGLCIFFFPPAAVRGRFFPRKPAAVEGAVLTPPSRRRVVIAVGAAYFAVQIVVSMRHLLYPGNVNWTEEGHRMSWRMMLRTKWGRIHYVVRDPASGVSRRVEPADELSTEQAERLATRPDMIWQYARRLARQFADKGVENAEVYAFTEVSLNGHPPQPLVDSSVDLAKVDWDFFGHTDWILPVKESAE